jgi:hypothetical protein
MFRVTYLFPILLLSMSPVANASVGKVEASAGSVVLVHGGQSAAPAPGAALETNDIVRTEAGGSARVVLTDGSALLMDQNTELRVVTHDPDTQQTLIELLHGHVRAITTPVVKPTGKFEIRTPTAHVVALGTAFDVQTAGAKPAASGPDLTLAENGQPIAGADVALALANMNKVSLGITDNKGKTNPSALDLANGGAADSALNLANLGKVPLRAEVDECSNGAKHVYLVGPNGQLPPPAKGCKRRILLGDFYWNSTQQVVMDTARGTMIATTVSTATTATGTTANSTASVANSAASAPQHLTDIPPGLMPGTAGATSLASYTGVQTTIVTALNHFVGVSNIDPTVLGVTYLLPGEGTFITRGKVPTAATDIREKEFTDNLFNNVLYHAQDSKIERYTFGFEKTLLDGNGSSSMCMPAVVVNGTPMKGDGLSVPSFRYKLTGMGTSTGNALHLQIWNDGQCALYFIITDGTIFGPHGYTEKVVISLLTGGIPPLKDFQKMISMGGMIRVPAGSVLAAGPAVPPTAGEAEVDLRSYCVELHKLAPHPKTEYRFGAVEDQQQLGANRPIVDKVFSMMQTGALVPPPNSNMDSIIQYSLWTKIEKLSPEQFMDEYKLLVHKNYEAKNMKWDKNVEKSTETAGQNLWGAVQKVLN